MSSQRIFVWPLFHADAFPHGINIALLSGEEVPAGPGVKLLGILLQALRRVVFWIDRDGVEEDIFAHTIAEQLVNLGELGRLQRADVSATREDEVDEDSLSLDEVVIKPDGLPVLSDKRRIREMIGAPVGITFRSRLGGAIRC